MAKRQPRQKAELLIITGLSGSGKGSVIRALEDLQHSDPSRYVRLRSAAALRQLNARGDQ